MMTPNERRVFRARKEKQTSALKILESSPDFPGVQVRTHDRVRELLDSDPSLEALVARTTGKMDHLIQVFDIRAEGLLRLVIDKKTHDAFTVALEQLCDWLWEQWSLLPIWALPPHGHSWRAQYGRLSSRAQHWVIEAYQKLDEQNQNKSVTPSEPQNIGRTLRLLREESRMTMEQVAEEIGVSIRTVERHESGDTSIRSTNLASYEELFSRKLGRTVRLS
jgi:DNA-binding XRE family transcriptional regulator